MQKLLCALVVAQCLAMALSIQCFHCSYNDFASSNPVVNFFFDAMKKLSNSDCQRLVPNSDFELNVRNCPPARPGHVYKCGVINGQVEASILEVIDVHYNTIERDCIEVPLDDRSFEDGCHDDLPSSGTIRNLVDQTFEGANLGDVTFSGEACFESAGIQVSSPICPRCTDTQVLTDNSVLQFFIDAIRLVSDKSCLMEDSEDIYDVNYQICPPTSGGEVAKCGNIDGRISGRLDVVGLDFEVVTQHRKCVTVPASEQIYSNGCHQNMDINNPVMAPLVSESLADTTGISGESFEGEACFEPYFAPLLAGGASSVTIHSAAALVSVLSAIMVMMNL